MGKLLFIVQANGGFYYDLFYLLALLIGYTLLIWIGVKRKYHLVSWLLVLAATRLLFILGTKLFSYSGQEWQIILTQYYFPAATGKTLLGGLLLVSIGYYFLKELLLLKNQTLDAFALVIPLSIALQRPGCFLAGCCYGNVTTQPWGIQYLPGTLPHFHQFQAGLIEAQSLYSLPVHPSQLYEVLNGLLVVGILLLLKKYVKAPGNTLILSMGLYCFFRFFTEFFRSPLAHSTSGSGDFAGGLIKIQWALLLAVLLFSTLFIYREKFIKPSKYIAQPPSVLTTILLLLVMVFTAWSLRNWFTFTELLAINMTLCPAIAWVSIYFFKNSFVPEYRWFAGAILILPLFLMSQTWPSNKAKVNPDSVAAQSYHTFKVGLGGGNYQNSHSIGQGSGCDRVSNTRYFKQEYTMGGAGYVITRKKQNSEVTYGLNAFSGTHRETDITTVPAVAPKENTIYGINPYVRLDTEWIGFGAGLHLGNLLYTIDNKDEDGYGIPTTGIKKTPIFPQAYFRVGITRILFADVQLANQFPSAFPGFQYQFGMGSGFGLKNGTYLRFGANAYGGVLSGNLVIQNRLVLEPLLSWGNNGTSPLGDRIQRQFAIGLHYRFNQQKLK